MNTMMMTGTADDAWSGDTADPGAPCSRARPIIGHRQDQVQASLSDHADERADQPYMRAAASSARWRNLPQIGGYACAVTSTCGHPLDQGSVVPVTLFCCITMHAANILICRSPVGPLLSCGYAVPAGMRS
jgi:hypothetical protein